jgi:hypothetical protein
VRFARTRVAFYPGSVECIILNLVLLDRLRDSFAPEGVRAEALVDDSIRFIEAVHGVAGRASYTFHYVDRLPGGAHGWQEQGEYVVVSAASRFPVLASIHEIGHALDAVFLNSVQFAVGPNDAPADYASDLAEVAEGTKDQGRTLLCGWLSAVRTTSHYRSIVETRGLEVITSGQAEQLRKLLRVRELWARSYELFIARRHPRSKIGREMNIECKDRAQIGSNVVYNYWQARDFDEVDAEIEQIFARLGWLTN